MALKGINTISRIMTQFMQDNDIECQALPSNEFCCLYDKGVIFYSFFGLGETEKMFFNTFINLGLEYTCDVFLMSWFHEVGHFMTLADIDDEDYQMALKVKQAQRMLPPPTTWKTLYKINQQYWRLADEKSANEWAVDFMNENREQIQTLWEEKLQPAILNFYKLNGLI